MGNNIAYQTAEYGKFLQLGADTAFPPISVVRLSYPDTSSAFPENSAVAPLSSVDVYPKYAVLTHLTNADDIKISLSGENINVSLDGLEDLGRIQNTIGFIQSFQLSAITSYVDDLEKNTFDTASACDDIYYALLSGIKTQVTNTVTVTVANLQDIEDLLIRTTSLLSTLTGTSNRINGFVIPDYNTIENYYHTTTTVIEKVEYKQNSTVVATLSFTYVDPLSASNPRLSKVIKL